MLTNGCKEKIFSHIMFNVKSCFSFAN